MDNKIQLEEEHWTGEHDTRSFKALDEDFFISIKSQESRSFIGILKQVTSY